MPLTDLLQVVHNPQYGRLGIPVHPPICADMGGVLISIGSAKKCILCLYRM
jgi:hypothetical protein